MGVIERENISKQIGFFGLPEANDLSDKWMSAPTTDFELFWVFSF